MSEENSGKCVICGGTRHITYTIDFEQCRPSSIRAETPPGFVRLCPGHYAEQDKEHDGKLDTLGDTMVSAHDHLYVKLEDKHDAMILSASQALSLLTWLLQERRYLEEIAAQVELTKEQTV